jgi:hypothetical protein
MEYKITITKQEENPEWEEKSNRMYAYNEPMQERYIEKFKTIATLDENQWKKVQKAIIESLN